MFPKITSPLKSTWLNVEGANYLWDELFTSDFNRYSKRISWRKSSVGFRLYQLNRYKKPFHGVVTRPNRVEVEVVTDLLNRFDGVIALGGGAPINKSIRELLGAATYPVIFIDVSIAQAANRIGFNKDRPLLLINPRQQWLSLMSVRRPIYEELASTVVSSDNHKPSEVAKKITQMIKSFI